MKEKPQRKRTAFTPPTPEEVDAYISDMGYGSDGFSGREFVDHYEAVGWMIGRNHMKSWKASVRTWHSKHKRLKTSKSFPERRPDNWLAPNGADERRTEV